MTGTYLRKVDRTIFNGDIPCFAEMVHESDGNKKATPTEADKIEFPVLAEYYTDDEELMARVRVRNEKDAEALHYNLVADVGVTGSKLWNERRNGWEWFIG